MLSAKAISFGSSLIWIVFRFGRAPSPNWKMSSTFSVSRLQSKNVSTSQLLNAPLPTFTVFSVFTFVNVTSFTFGRPPSIIVSCSSGVLETSITVAVLKLFLGIVNRFKLAPLMWMPFSPSAKRRPPSEPLKLSPSMSKVSSTGKLSI